MRGVLGLAVLASNVFLVWFSIKDGNQTQIADDTADARVTDYTTSYDDLARPTQVQELNAGGTVLRDTDYDYDLNGNITSITATRNADPTGDPGEDRANLATSRTTSYQWDARNLVTKLTTNTPTQSARSWTYTYNPAGMLQTLTKPNAAGAADAGNLTRYTYYEDGRVRSQVERRSTGELASSHQLWYTPDGDPAKDLTKVDNADATAAPYLEQTVNYDYTPTRLLESVTKSARVDEGPSEEYTYDAAGNIIRQVMGSTDTQGKVTTTNDYDRSRLISSTINGNTSIDYTYDGFGRLTRTPGGGETVDYTYDGFDRLTRQVTQDIGGATTVDSGYDPLDRVTLQITDTGTNTTRTRFGYLGLTEQVATEEQRDTTSGDWQVVKAYAYGPDGTPVSLDSVPRQGVGRISLV